MGHDDEGFTEFETHFDPSVRMAKSAFERVVDGDVLVAKKRNDLRRKQISQSDETLNCIQIHKTFALSFSSFTLITSKRREKREERRMESYESSCPICCWKMETDRLRRFPTASLSDL